MVKRCLEAVGAGAAQVYLEAMRPGSLTGIMDGVPVRVQLRRTRGWRKPTGAIVVARPSRWGNPFRIGIDGDRIHCVAFYREALVRGELAFFRHRRAQGVVRRDLACWCPAHEPCHADVLLEVANQP